jgi:hypothetical protein
VLTRLCILKIYTSDHLNSSDHLYIVEPATEAESPEGGNGNPHDHICPNVIGIAILEFGAILHRCAFGIDEGFANIISISVLIGLTLAVDVKFKVLFAVLVTHRASLALYLTF